MWVVRLLFLLIADVNVKGTTRELAGGLCDRRPGERLLDCSSGAGRQGQSWLDRPLLEMVVSKRKHKDGMEEAAWTTLTPSDGVAYNAEMRHQQDSEGQTEERQRIRQGYRVATQIQPRSKQLQGRGAQPGASGRVQTTHFSTQRARGAKP